MEALKRLSFLARFGISVLLAAVLVTSAPLVNAQDPAFNIAVSPSGLCINLGSTATYQITVTSIGGFSGQVQMGDDISPNVSNGPTLGPIPETVTVGSSQDARFSLSVTTTDSTPSQVYTISVAGIAGSQYHYTSVYLAFDPSCGTVGGTISPASGFSFTMPLIGFAIAISAIAGAVSFAFIRTRERRIGKN